MTEAKLLKRNSRFIGFQISGHTGYAKRGKDIVCASISSAVQITANAITEVVKAKAEVLAKGDIVTLNVLQDSDMVQVLIESLHLHLTLLKQEYPGTIDIHIVEVE